MPTATKRREFLQLADTYNPDKHKIGGFYISEKLDGGRCFWDGGLTRGVPIGHIPWAGITDPKTGLRKAKFQPVATGLWSRYGNVIMAPDWFLNELPCCPLDGELWAGRGKFQLTMSIVRGDTPDPRFNQIDYAVYSSPPLDTLFSTGLIKNANMLRQIDVDECEKFVRQRMDEFEGDFTYVAPSTPFEGELHFLRGAIDTQSRIFLHQQVQLPGDEDKARQAANEHLAKVLDKGGEGCIIRSPFAVWTPKRHKGLLKFKPFEDAEGEIIGYVAGKEGKQGNILGKIGAVIVKFGNVEFEIGSGLTFEDREFQHQADIDWATEFPGERMPDHALGKHLKLGHRITFKYRELSDDGIPKEARYWRRRDAE